MNTTNKDGGPAFPVDCIARPDGHLEEFCGMSVRDYFAGQALAGACANPSYLGTATFEMAEVAYLLADRMIEARRAVKP